jgi:predicted transcriptional regulator
MHRRTADEDRVRTVARQLSEPRTANWIASEADWSHEPTKRVLERLVDDGILHRDESGTHTTYYPDYRWQAIQEARRLRDSGHTVEELTDRLTEMRAQIRDWEENSASSHPIGFAGHSPMRPSTPTRKIVGVRSLMSGNTFSAASRSSDSPFASGTSSLRRENLLRFHRYGILKRKPYSI